MNGEQREVVADALLVDFIYLLVLLRQDVLAQVARYRHQLGSDSVELLRRLRIAAARVPHLSQDEATCRLRCAAFLRLVISQGRAAIDRVESTVIAAALIILHPDPALTLSSFLQVFALLMRLLVLTSCGSPSSV